MMGGEEEEEEEREKKERFGEMREEGPQGNVVRVQ